MGQIRPVARGRHRVPAAAGARAGRRSHVLHGDAGGPGRSMPEQPLARLVGHADLRGTPPDDVRVDLVAVVRRRGLLLVADLQQERTPEFGFAIGVVECAYVGVRQGFRHQHALRGAVLQEQLQDVLQFRILVAAVVQHPLPDRPGRGARRREFERQGHVRRLHGLDVVRQRLPDHLLDLGQHVKRGAAAEQGPVRVHLGNDARHRPHVHRGRV
mmetsp:Transcript_22065/g.65864  ORF Transcript_22065/g.65864 Transcript_22065/m.65864 type:complete len:214 (+) Transcript_22065:13-654(+)